MANRSWWAAAGAAVAVLAVIAVGMATAGGDGPDIGSADGAGAGGQASPSGGWTSGEEPIRGGGPSSDDSGTPMPLPQPTGSPPRPGTEPSPVAPRDQLPKPDRPLAFRIDSYETVAPDRLQVRYTTGVPECYGRLARAAVQEHDERVVVTLLRQPSRATDAVCPEIALVRDVEVTLERPLGGRTVVDGSTGHQPRHGHVRP